MKLRVKVGNNEFTTIAEGEGEALFTAAEEHLKAHPDYNTLTLVTDPLPDDEVFVNVCMGLGKSANHIRWLSGQEFPIVPRSRTRHNIAEYRTSLDNVRGPIRYNVIDNTLSITLTETPSGTHPVRSYQASCGLIRRVVNMVTWCATMEVKLKSGSPFTRETFNSITVYKIFKKDTHTRMNEGI
jgi:hypothetical protein